MRRWIAAVALAGAAMVLMTGCSTLPSGVDGNLTNNWADFPEPKGWTPEPNNCQAGAFNETVYLSAYAPVACTTTHRTETIAVGQFSSSVSKLPARADANFLTAYKDCDTKATSFLGGHWQDGKLWLGVSLPSSDAWAGGARWYRCEVVQLDEMWGDAVTRSATLKDGLKNDPTVTIGCQKYASKVGFTPIACTTKHNAEFVGSYFGVTSYSKLKDNTAMASACRGIIAKYVGIKNSSDMKYRVGVVWDYPTTDDWNAGDHGLRCWAWFGTETKTKSIKGVGSKGLPIHYA